MLLLQHGDVVVALPSGLRRAVDDHRQDQVHDSHAHRRVHTHEEHVSPRIPLDDRQAHFAPAVARDDCLGEREQGQERGRKGVRAPTTAHVIVRILLENLYVERVDDLGREHRPERERAEDEHHAPHHALERACHAPQHEVQLREQNKRLDEAAQAEHAHDPHRADCGRIRDEQLAGYIRDDDAGVDEVREDVEELGPEGPQPQDQLGRVQAHQDLVGDKAPIWKRAAFYIAGVRLLDDHPDLEQNDRADEHVALGRAEHEGQLLARPPPGLVHLRPLLIVVKPVDEEGLGVLQPLLPAGGDAAGGSVDLIQNAPAAHSRHLRPDRTRRQSLLRRPCRLRLWFLRSGVRFDGCSTDGLRDHDAGTPGCFVDGRAAGTGAEGSSAL
mmetsp:Transcript_3247/g.8810  ORF Transcript_3247/g.8810 Transcript_3247/m.8810 type:complete len:385 (-) Transcript_3247:46-1200(-)